MRGVGRAVVVATLVSACADTAGRGAPGWSPSVGDGGDGADGDDDGGAELDVDPIDSSSSTFGGDEEGGDEGFNCNGDDAQACMCPDGPGMGIQFCEDGMWGPCTCDGGTDGTGTTGEVSDGTTTDASTDDGGTTTGAAPATEVCFPGSDNSFTTCLPVHAFDPNAPPDGYDYPDALGGDPNYRRPVAFLDLDEVDGTTYIAPNFQLEELAQAYKGQYAIVQPHAVVSLQAVRDAAGALNVNSGYRSPSYNVDIGGATYSRHMYGDAFDLDPVNVTVDELEAICEDNGGMLVEYETHVHCDWRFDDVAPEFFGDPAPAGPAELAFAARIEPDGEALVAPADGFDEGEPMRRWVALDHDGRVLVRATGRSFRAPSGTARVEVTVGARVHAVVQIAKSNTTAPFSSSTSTIVASHHGSMSANGSSSK